MEQLVRDERCERLVLGTIMTRSDALDEVTDLLDGDCFYTDLNRRVYKAVSRLHAKGGEPSIINVRAELETMGTSTDFLTIAEIAKNVAFEGFRGYALRLRELAARRRLWVLGNTLLKVGESEVLDLDDVEKELGKTVDEAFYGGGDGTLTLDEALTRVMERVSENARRRNRPVGCSTGFRKLDEKGGLQPSDLVIIAAETSQGKTSAALNISFNAAQAGRNVAIYSMEMTAEQLAARILSSQSGVTVGDILYNGYLTSDAFGRLDTSVGQIGGMGILFDESSTSNIDSILSSIRRMKKKYDISGAVIDYLQILNVNQREMNTEQAMGDATRRLKNLAKELGIWIIALSQLARNRENPEPTLTRLRSSGQIEEAADIVLLIYRPEVYGREFPGEHAGKPTQGRALFKVAKGRNIGTFDFIVGFNAATTTFSDVEECEVYSHAPANPDIKEEDAPF